MNNIPLKSLAAIIIRLFAVFITIYAIRNLLSISFYYADDTYSTAVWISWGFSILFFITAIILWTFPNLIAKKIISWDVEETNKEKTSAEEIEVVGFSLIGLFYLYYAISDLVYWAIFTLFIQKSYDVPVDLSIEQKVNIIVTVVEFLFALIIILRARGLVGLLRKIRNAGL
jgi:hypothetical protein